jgi:hypothetical protein
VPDKRHPPGPAQAVGGARDLAVGVLDRLGLVEDHGVPGDLGQLVDVVAHQRVGGDREVGVEAELAPAAVVQRHRQVGAEPRGLGAPVGRDRRRTHDQGPAVDRGQGLHGLAETHVVGEDAAQAGQPAER